MTIARSTVNMTGVSFVLLASLLVPAGASAGPVVREATGLGAAAIQAAVDLFRSDLGNPNNGVTPGSQPGGRREITWDGGGAAANAATFPVPMTTFANRGAVFVTPGTGFEISGQPSPEFGDVNGTYANLFAPFSSPRLFAPLNSNVMDVWFFVPGPGTVPAAVTGFGAVFTDVDSAGAARLEFYAPDGALLYQRDVPYTAGNESLSFLGVSFNAGEVVARVRIVSGNAAFGPDETGALNLVAMDDFIYGEPVATAGLTIAPATGTLFKSGTFDIVVGLEGLSATVASAIVRLNGADVTQAFGACAVAGRIVSGGDIFRCPAPRGFLPPGQHVVWVELTLSDQTRLRNSVRWTIVDTTP